MSQSIIEAAKAIIPHLPELLGEQAEPMRQQLQAVFDKQADEAQREIELIDLLSEHEATRAWMNAQLQRGEEKTKGGTLEFDELGGNRGDVGGATYYKCPAGDRGHVPGAEYYVCDEPCDYRWTKTLDWQTPPKCPVHGCDLVKDD